MIARTLRSSSGFTYMMLLIMVLVMGIMLGAVGQSWRMVMKREREAELLFRGKQIVDAIARWQNPKNLPGAQPPRPLRDLKDLLKDPSSAGTVRYLRRDPTTFYNDPVTGKEWDVIRDPQNGVIGVKSRSEEEPIKQGNFVEMYNLDPAKDNLLIAMYKNFEGKKSYKEWQFVYGAAQGTMKVTPVGQTPGPGQMAPAGQPQGMTGPSPSPGQ